MRARRVAVLRRAAAIHGVAVLALALSGPARAAVLESEPNGAGSPDALPMAAGGVLARGALEPGDVDYWSIDLAEDDFVTAAVLESGKGAFHDPMVAVFPPGAGTPAAVDDDDGPGLLPALRWRVPVGQGGTWRIAVTGFGDGDLDGTGHSEALAYELVVSKPPPVPESQDGTNGTTPEPIGTAPFDALAPGGVVFVHGTLGAANGSPGDVDRYAVPVEPGRRLGVAIFDDGAGTFHDPVLRLLDGAGTPLGVANDDAGPGLLAALAGAATPGTATTWTVEVERFADDPGDDEDFDYALVVTQTGRLCDANGDASVDETDVEAVFAARGTSATGPGDARDLNGDGSITVSDARKCALVCDHPDCAPTPACGLLGIEALLPLLLARRGRRLLGRRGRRHRVLPLLGAAVLLAGAPGDARAVSISLVPDFREVVLPDAGGIALSVDVVVTGLGDGGAPSVGTYDLDLVYDPALFVLEGVDFGAGLGGPGSVVEGASAPDGGCPSGGSSGIVDFAAVSLLAPAALDALQGESLVLATVSLRACSAGEAMLALVQDASAEVADAFGDPLPVDSVAGAGVRVVPEPASAALLLAGAVGLAGMARRAAGRS